MPVMLRVSGAALLVLLSSCASSNRPTPTSTAPQANGDCASASDPAGCVDALSRSMRDDAGQRRALRERLGSYCERGVLRACAFQGSMTLAGRGGPRDEAAGARLVQRACDGSDLPGCAAWGGALVSGRGVAADPARGVPILERACQGVGAPEACDYLGTAHALGLGVTRDMARARQLYERACDQDVEGACFNLAVLLRSGASPTPDEMARAARYIERSCERSLENGCTAWADMLRTGSGVTADPAAAVRVATRACDGDDGQACGMLGGWYERGEAGLAVDMGRAMALYRKACIEHGSAPACRWAGDMHRLGRGAPQDHAESLRYYLRACEGGVARGCSSAASQYFQGEGTTRNVERSAELGEQACRLGEQEACAASEQVRRMLAPPAAPQTPR